VTKKRTIDIEETTTAWDVLQSCLSTYRCECEIDTLKKQVNIYEEIGNDRGCYFVEGLNLRKLTATSDTYEFYTRIIPIGKDGITIEWEGKDYLENYQYSDKIKTYTWKDERYTNTSSLIEDAEAKLEELSKPYKVYSAEVADLAKANPEYQNILDYGIGDTVTMVSKHPRTREKQRIVKIVEYPETPEKNTVELSNTNKTFAEVQKTETELAKQEAISIAKSTTKKTLADNYYNKTEVETYITASEEKISLGVSEKLEGYYTSEETDAKMEMTAHSITLFIDNSEGTSAGIKIQLLNENGEEIDAVSGNVEITGVVKFADLANEGSTVINGSNITTGTIDADVVNVINVVAKSVAAEDITGTTFSGKTIVCNSGEFGGWKIGSNSIYSGEEDGNYFCLTTNGNAIVTSNSLEKTVISSGRIMLYAKNNKIGTIQPLYSNNDRAFFINAEYGSQGIYFGRTINESGTGYIDIVLNNDSNSSTYSKVFNVNCTSEFRNEVTFTGHINCYDDMYFYDADGKNTTGAIESFYSYLKDSDGNYLLDGDGGKKILKGLKISDKSGMFMLGAYDTDEKQEYRYITIGSGTDYNSYTGYSESIIFWGTSRFYSGVWMDTKVFFGPNENTYLWHTTEKTGSMLFCNGHFGVNGVAYTDYGLAVQDIKGNLNLNGSYVSASASDIRLKKDVVDTEINALDIVGKIKFREFVWKETDKKQKVGIIADELEEIDKNLVLGTEGGYVDDEQSIPVYKSIDILYLCSYLGKAIQEQQGQIETLKKSIELLQEKGE
jgi:hypothetical protein